MWEMTFCLNTYLESLISCKEITYVITGNYNLQYFLFFHITLLFPIFIFFFPEKNILFNIKTKKMEKYEMRVSSVLQMMPAFP